MEEINKKFNDVSNEHKGWENSLQNHVWITVVKLSVTRFRINNSGTNQ
jgi:hypothetical protein